MLTELSIHNYKSIRDVKLQNIPDFSVLVGANGAGKSNFADALDFLSLVFSDGLADAVRSKGGYENICFRKVKRSKAGLTFSIKASMQEIRTRLYSFTYEFSYRATREAIFADYEVTNEEMTVEIWSGNSQREGRINIQRRKGLEPLVEVDPPGIMERRIAPPQEYFSDLVTRALVSQDELLVVSRLSRLPPFILLQSIPNHASCCAPNWNTRENPGTRQAR